MRISSIEEKNGAIAAIFLFQYSLLIPAMRFFSPSSLVAISGVLLMVASFLINRKIVVQKESLFTIGLLVVLMLIKYIIDGSDITVALNLLMIAIPPIIIYTYGFSCTAFLKYCQRLSLINFIVLFLLPIIKWEVAYMRFGYGMTLTVLFSYIRIFHNSIDDDPSIMGQYDKAKKYVNLLAFIISLAEVIIYGSRGALIVILAFVAIDILLIYKKNRIRNSLLIGLGFVTFINLESILSLLLNFTSRFGIKSYALRKYQYQLQVGFEEASSGRMHLFERAIETIKQYPLIGAQMVRYDDGTLYVHNLFLQVGRDLGVITMLILIAFVGYSIYLLTTRKLGINEKTMIAVIFCMSVVRLLISSNIWERPEFWVLLCVVFKYRHILTRREYYPVE